MIELTFLNYKRHDMDILDIFMLILQNKPLTPVTEVSIIRATSSHATDV